MLLVSLSLPVRFNECLLLEWMLFSLNQPTLINALHVISFMDLNVHLIKHLLCVFGSHSFPSPSAYSETCFARHLLREPRHPSPQASSCHPRSLRQRPPLIPSINSPAPSFNFFPHQENILIVIIIGHCLSHHRHLPPVGCCVASNH